MSTLLLDEPPVHAIRKDTDSRDDYARQTILVADLESNIPFYHCVLGVEYKLHTTTDSNEVPAIIQGVPNIELLICSEELFPPGSEVFPHITKPNNLQYLLVGNDKHYMRVVAKLTELIVNHDITALYLEQPFDKTNLLRAVHELIG